MKQKWSAASQINLQFISDPQHVTYQETRDIYSPSRFYKYSLREGRADIDTKDSYKFSWKYWHSLYHELVMVKQNNIFPLKLHWVKPNICMKNINYDI